MSENVHLCLSDLLDSDISSYEFYNTLSPELQKELKNKDIRTFEELQNCAKKYRKNDEDSRGEILDYYNPASSATDCTGLIPNGANYSDEDIKIYKSIYPFSNPPQTTENGWFNSQIRFKEYKKRLPKSISRRLYFVLKFII